LWLAHFADDVHNRFMNTKHGLRGTIDPPGSFRDESLQFVGFSLDIKDGLIEIGFDDMADEGKARDIVRQYLEWFSFSHGVRHTVDLNQSWKMQPGGGKMIGVQLNDTLTVSDDLTH